MQTRSTAAILEQIIAETTNRMNRLSCQESENEVKLAQLHGEEEQENAKSAVLKIKQLHQVEMARAEGDDQWYSITHYGWRIAWASIYPNAVAIRPVDGPDVRIIPWFNIFFFVFLIVAIVTVRVMWNQFRERKVDPLLDLAGDRLDEVQAGVAERRSGLLRWLNTWRKKEDRK